MPIGMSTAAMSLQLKQISPHQFIVSYMFPLAVSKGDRVAQLVLEKIATPEVIEVYDLDNTERGNGGFGSTGVAARQ